MTNKFYGIGVGVGPRANYNKGSKYFKKIRCSNSTRGKKGRGKYCI